MFTIKNVGLDRFVVAVRAACGVRARQLTYRTQEDGGALVVAYGDDATPAEFRVQPAGDGFVEVRAARNRAPRR